tara:strand:- start:35 stop:586 length:552 start_codon:yes stop_codon:yes gene_type:complete
MVNAYYRNNGEKIKDVFAKEGFVVLFDFLEKEEFERIKKELDKVTFEHEKEPLTHSYAKAKIPYSLCGDNFIDFISLIINIDKDTIIKTKSTLFQFKHKDYTIRNDDTKEELGIDIIFNISDWDKEFGGTLYYIDSEGEYKEVPVKANTLTIVKRKEGVSSFVKYVNFKAGKRKKLFLKISCV